MNYKIVFSDIDGTLLDQNRQLSAMTIAEIKKLKDSVPFILISARMPAAMRHLQQELGIEDLPVICYNGGLVLVDNEIISSTEIPIDLAEDMITWNAGCNCHLSLYHKDEWYVPQMDQWALREQRNTKVDPQVRSGHNVIQQWRTENKGVHKIMAMGDEAKIDQLRDYLSGKYSGQLHLYRSKSTYLEISDKRVSKYSAVELLLKEHYHFQPEEAIAFGDNYNDVEMLQKIGYGIAVGNARQEVKDVANIHTANSIEDGVAKSLLQLFKA